MLTQHVNMENQNSSPQQKPAWIMEHWHNACSDMKQQMMLRPATTAEHRTWSPHLLATAMDEKISSTRIIMQPGAKDSPPGRSKKMIN